MNSDTEIKEEIRTIEGFERVFKTHYSALCRYVFGFLHEEEAAEEIVQELFYKLWQKRNEIEIKGSLKSYLFKAVRNESLNLVKHIKVREGYKKHHERERALLELSKHDHLESSETLDRIAAAIAKLPEQRQLIFRMSRFENMKYREIAEKLNLSIKTIENQMGKALASLRSELSDLIPSLLIIIQILLWG